MILVVKLAMNSLIFFTIASILPKIINDIQCIADDDNCLNPFPMSYVK